MKKTFLFIAACAFAMLANAQILEVVSTQQLPTEKGTMWKVAGFSPIGDFILLTDTYDKGLIRYDLSKRSTHVISEGVGAGWAVKISEDGKNIIYREKTMDANKITRSNIYKHSMVSNQRSMQAKDQMGMTGLVDNSANIDVIINTDLKIVLVRNGKQIVLQPNGANERYISANLSPDNKHIIYRVSGKGCFICDLAGKNVQFIAARCHAPQWYDNHTVIAMDYEDDGEKVTASGIVAYTLDGKSQVLVDKSQMAIYPHTANGQIAYSNTKGEVFLMTVK